MTAALHRFGPLVGTLVFFAVGVGWRVWLHRRRYGTTGIVLFRAPGLARRVLDSLLLVLPPLIFVYCVLVAFAPERLGALAPLEALMGGLSAAAGVALLLAGTALMSLSQHQMGASWRIGIEEEARPGLVVHGVYRLSRNPIYLGMFLGFAGLVALAPSALTAAVFLAVYAGVRRQVSEEEDYLRRTYGEPYVAYGRRVGRFLPGVGTFG